MIKATEQPTTERGLHIVSIFEVGKGVLVLIAGFGLLAYVHKDLHLAVEQLVRHFHLNPASRYPRIFIDLAGHITDSRLWVLAFFAFLYAAVRFIEAYGLWMRREWAEWFGLLSGGMYVPIELFEVAQGATWPKITVLVVNAGIVGYLAYVLYRSHRSSSLIG